MHATLRLLLIGMLVSIVLPSFSFGQDADSKEVEELRRQLDLLKRENERLKDVAAKLQIDRAKVLAELERRTKEMKLLTDAVAAREKVIVEQEKKLADLLRERLAGEAEKRAALARLDATVREVAALRQKLVVLEAGAAVDKKELPRSKDPNPPANKVRGKVVKLDEKSGLILIDVGSDLGLKHGHTLEVFRLQPRPEYVGMLRIESVEPRTALGRMVDGRNTAKVKTEDQVADSIQR